MTKDSHFDEIAAEITRLKQREANQAHTIEELKNEYEEEVDALCKELLAVLDAFDKADTRSAERFPDDEHVNKVRRRFATPKDKLTDILQRWHVKEITFPEGKATTDDCKIVDTTPDTTKEDDTIISIEKRGYRRAGRLLRLAEVIVVKN